VTQKLGSYAPWYRLYQSRYSNPLGYGFGSSRFSDPEKALPPSDRFGIVYFGSRIKVCNMAFIGLLRRVATSTAKDVEATCLL
jgi:hypothetical protein